MFTVTLMLMYVHHAQNQRSWSGSQSFGSVCWRWRRHTRPLPRPPSPVGVYDETLLSNFCYKVGCDTSVTEAFTASAKPRRTASASVSAVTEMSHRALQQRCLSIRSSSGPSPAGSPARQSALCCLHELCCLATRPFLAAPCCYSVVGSSR